MKIKRWDNCTIHNWNIIIFYLNCQGIVTYLGFEMSSQSTLTESQKARIEKNRQKALLLKKSKVVAHPYLRKWVLHFYFYRKQRRTSINHKLINSEGDSMKYINKCFVSIKNCVVGHTFQILGYMGFDRFSCLGFI